MTLVQVILLALIQGLTEFLPISSSAHLILPSALLDWPDQGLAFDVAVHVGTLIAVLGYFRRDLHALSFAWVRSLSSGKSSPESKLAWSLIISTIPAGLAGLVFNDFIEMHLRSVLVIATTTLFFGIILGLADHFGLRSKSISSMGWKPALLIGLSQILALIPGTSRSGITMTAALAIGFDRVTAARFSFLMSVPIILLSGAYKSVELVALDNVPWFDIGLATLVSGVTAYLCIRIFLKIVNRIGMMPFVGYRVILAAILFVMVLTMP